jgi:hypothetical protein
MSTRKNLIKSWAGVLPAGKVTAIPPNARNIDFKPNDDIVTVLPSESGDVYTSFDLSVLTGLEKTRR